MAQIEDSNKNAVINSKPQLFCTDTVSLSNRDIVKIAKLSDLPYYKDHEQIVKIRKLFLSNPLLIH